MEGRTIARPNQTVYVDPPYRNSTFNGGPDNCPAKLSCTWTVTFARCTLQWRAGQLPGQTSCGATLQDIANAPFNGGPDNCPAKPLNSRCPTPSPSSFNGGPDNCPAKPAFQPPTR